MEKQFGLLNNENMKKFMKKGVRKEYIIGFLILLLAFVPLIVVQNNKMTGKAVGGPPESVSGGGDEGFQGPSDSEMACMVKCTTRECDISDMDCRVAHGTECGLECGVETEAPKPANEDEECMQQCITRGCDDEYDFNCQRANVVSCENKCFEKAPDESEMSEEQLCISQCVSEEDPSVICGSGTFEGEGETGNALCQRCANECVHLYAGPCLTDELWREKEDACMATGEHMEAAPLRGDSGEGYECTVDIECIDRSSEWGDEPGEGPGIGQEGYVAPNAIAGAIDGVVKFFKGIFGGGEETQASSESSGTENIQAAE